jgi:uncharacterized protein (TIGR03084 family)
MDQTDYDALLTDLTDEEAELDALVAELDDVGWTTPTPAEGWTVHDQIAHLAATEEWARRSLEEPDGFHDDLAAYAADPDARAAGLLDGRLGRSQPEGTTVLEWWRTNRRATTVALRARQSSDRVPWFGPDMSVASFATARVMETWAHGQDVADALGIERLPTDRLRHVAEIGVRARPFSYASRGIDLPTTDVRVDLVAPGGERWTWGPEDADDVVSGDALDWCLVATQRRNPADTRLTATGDAATEWLGFAQAFAGPPTEHRPPGAAPRPGATRP